MTLKSDLFVNIGIGFGIGAFLTLVAGGPEMWGFLPPEGLLAFVSWS